MRFISKASKYVSFLLMIMLVVPWISVKGSIITVDIPSSLKSESSGYASILTTWGTVSGATGYQVYRSTTSSGEFTLVNTTRGTSFNNAELVTGKSYYFKVRAFVLVGATRIYGNYTPVVSAKPIPSTPSTFRAVSSGYNWIKTTWGAVKGASGYQVYRSNTSSGDFSIVNSTRGTSFDDTGLETGSNYYYKVRPFTTVGLNRVYGKYSQIISAKPIPTAPSSVNIAPSGYDSISISWKSVDGASGYQILRSTSSTGTYSIVSATKGTTFKNTGLNSGTTYFYKIRPFTTVGTTRVYGNHSSIVSIKLPVYTPINFTANPIGPNSIKLTWSNVAGATGYRLYYSISEDGTYNSLDINGLEYVHSNLIAGTKYFYKIRAIVQDGITRSYSNYSAIFSATTNAILIPDGKYNIISMESNTQYFNCYSDASSQYPWQLVSAPQDNSNEQVIRFIKQLDGTYKMMIDSYNRVIGVSGSVNMGAKLVATANTDELTQRYNITRVSGNYYTISPSGFPNLVISRTTQKTYANIEQYAIELQQYTGAPNQYWSISTIQESLPILPIDKTKGSWYGLTYWEHDTYGKYQYSAVDFNLLSNADSGTNVYSVQDGIVDYISSTTVIIKHTIPLVLRNGYTYSVWYSFYGHMSDVPLLKGQQLKKGMIIGKVGKVGATTEHLHFVLCTSYNSSTSTVVNSISPYWLKGDYNNMALYADNPYGTREPAGLYETLIFRAMPY